jgi:hypothetical protein
MIFWDVILCKLVKCTDVSQEHAASIFWANLKMDAAGSSKTLSLYML